MSWAPTTDQILDLDGVRRRKDRFRFELCDRELNPIGNLHPDRSESVPAIENDTANNTSRRLRGFKLLPAEAGDINVNRDRLRVYVTLQNGAEFRLGTFLWADENRPLRSWGIEQHADLVDFTYILDQKSTRPFGWGRGAGPIGLIMIFLVMRVGFELSDIAIIGEEASRSLAEPMSWEPGTTWLQMLTDLCNLVGFATPWFDRDGKLHLDQPPDPAFMGSDITPYGPGTRVITDSIVPSNDLIRAPNDFAVFDSGTDRQRVGRFQLPSSAPHSFPNRGYRIGETDTVQGLETQAQADKGARNLARTRGVAYEWLTFSSTLDPRHDTWNIVEAWFPELGDDNGFDHQWLETAWLAELRSGGLMQHTMKRTSYEL